MSTPLIYRCLLRFCPAEFRERFGEEVIATALSVSRERSGGRARALVDAARTVIGLRRDVRRDRRVGGSVCTGVGLDLRDASRTLIREPRFTGFVVGILAIAIGAVVTLFALSDRLLLSGPLALEDAGAIRRAELVADVPNRGIVTRATVGHVLFAAIRDQARLVQAASYARNEGTLGHGATSRRVFVGYASEQLFPLLGVTAARGRMFDASEHGAGSGAPVLVSAGFARAEFGDAVPMGTIIQLNGVPRTIIGVLPTGFTGAELSPVDVWLPIDGLNRTVTPQWQTTWNAQWLQVVIRRAHGASDTDVEAELSNILRRAYDGPSPILRAATMRVVPLTVPRDADQAVDLRVLRWLASVAALVFLVACANVTSIMLARSIQRQREVGVRLALGAPRGGVVRLFLIEAALLATAATVAGAALSMLLTRAGAALLFSGVDWTIPLINVRTLVVAGAAVIVTTLVIGLLPAVAASRPSVVTALRGALASHSGRSRLRSGLAVAQAAGSVVLLIGAGLFLRSFWHARTIDLGVDADRLLIVEVDRAPLDVTPAGVARDRERERRRRFLTDAVPALHNVPGVERAAVAVGMPFGFSFGVPVMTPGGRFAEPVAQSISAVSPDYFAVVGTPIVDGRPFQPEEGRHSAPVAVVSRLFATQAWPGQSPLGRCLIVGDGPCAAVVGVAGDTHRQRLRESPVAHVYVPVGQEAGFGGDVLLVRAAGDLAGAAPVVRERIAALDPSITTVRTESLRTRIDPQMHAWRMGATVFVFAGVLALVIAAAGVYSVLAYVVTARRRDIGIRLALGAPVLQVGGVVVRSGLRLVAAGISLGVVVAWTLSPRLESMLFDVSPHDPLVYATVGGVLGLVAIVASLAPALRAARLDPLVVLRGE